jgi:hypothetical protein
MPKTVYISGPMTGMSDLNKKAFDEAQTHLESYGAVVVNPHDVGIDAECYPGFDELSDGEKWEIYLRYDLAAMLMCDMVCTLDGWDDSRGALLEVNTAKAVGIPVMPWRGFPF